MDILSLTFKIRLEKSMLRPVEQLFN